METPAPTVVRPAVIGRVARVRAEMAEYERLVERCRRNLEDDFYPYLTAAERVKLGLDPIPAWDEEDVAQLRQEAATSAGRDRA